MRDPKYSILFMRDDTDVRRFRVSPNWLRTYLAAQAVLILLAVAGIWLGVTSWWDNRVLTSEKNELAKRLEEAELRLSTLANMEKILEAYDKSELQSLLAGPKEGVQEGAVPVDLNKVFTSVDEGVVIVDEVKSALTSTTFSLSFKLENRKTDTLLSGDTEIHLITSDGRKTPLEGNPRDLAFQIRQRKFVRTTVPLPDGMEKNDLFAVSIAIKRSDGMVIFSDTYPLHTILQ